MSLYRISFCSLVLSLATLPEAIAGLPANLLSACVQQVVQHVATQQQSGRQDSQLQRSRQPKYTERIVFVKKTSQPGTLALGYGVSYSAIGYTTLSIDREQVLPLYIDARQLIAAQNLRLMI